MTHPLSAPVTPASDTKDKSSFVARHIFVYGHKNLLNRRNKQKVNLHTHTRMHTHKLEMLRNTKVFFLPFSPPGNVGILSCMVRVESIDHLKC